MLLSAHRRYSQKHRCNGTKRGAHDGELGARWVVRQDAHVESIDHDNLLGYSPSSRCPSCHTGCIGHYPSLASPSSFFLLYPTNRHDMFGGYTRGCRGRRTCMETSRHRGKQHLAWNAGESRYLPTLVSSSLYIRSNKTNNSRLCTSSPPFSIVPRLPPFAAPPNRTLVRVLDEVRWS